MNLRHFGLALGLAGLGLVASSVPAQALTWTLNNVVFEDGGRATGTFDYDADTNTYSNHNISVNGGDTNTFPAFTYNNSNSESFGDRTFLEISNNSGSRDFVLVFSTLLTNEEGTITFSEGYDANYSEETGRSVTAGSVTTSATAVPFNFSPGQGIALGLPLFISLRILKKRAALRKSKVRVEDLVS